MPLAIGCAKVHRPICASQNRLAAATVIWEEANLISCFPIGGGDYPRCVSASSLPIGGDPWSLQFTYANLRNSQLLFDDYFEGNLFDPEWIPDV